TDDAGISIEVLAPNAIIDQHDARRIGMGVLVTEEAAGGRWNAENFEGAGADLEAEEVFGFDDSGEHEVAPTPDGGLFERGDTVLPLIEGGPGDAGGFALVCAAVD